MTGTDLNALISSRICHDLISPLGAIGNGVELLTMSGLNDSPEMALIAESVENANARIRFFRVAFGAARPGIEISQSEVQSILRDSYRSNRTRVDWTVEGALLRQEVKIAFLAIQCLENALPWGGRITISRTGQSWNLDARGEKTRVEPELWNMLSGAHDDTDVVAADVHFALIATAASAAGRRLSTTQSDTRVTLSF